MTPKNLSLATIIFTLILNTFLLASPSSVSLQDNVTGKNGITISNQDGLKKNKLYRNSFLDAKRHFAFVGNKNIQANVKSGSFKRNTFLDAKRNFAFSSNVKPSKQSIYLDNNFIREKRHLAFRFPLNNSLNPKIITNYKNFFLEQKRHQ